MIALKTPVVWYVDGFRRKRHRIAKFAISTIAPPPPLFPFVSTFVRIYLVLLVFLPILETSTSAQRKQTIPPY